MKIPNRKEFEKQYKANLSPFEKVLNKLQVELKRDLEHSGLHSTIKVRIKSFASYYGKILRLLSKHKNLQEASFIYDVLGMRIVCPFLDDLKAVESHIKQKFDVVEMERRGSDHSFREFGYKSTHFLINVPSRILSRCKVEEPLVCEIQLHTILQDAWSEVEHELVYKADFSPFDEPLKRKLAALNANLTLSDTLFQEIRDYQRKLQVELKKRRNNFMKIIQNTTEDSTPVMRQGLDVSNNGQKKETGTIDTHELSIQVEKSIDDLLIEALDAHNCSQFKKAIAIYSWIMKRELPDHIKSVIFIHRGMAYFAKSNCEQALKDFTSALKLSPENYKALYYRGLTYQMLQNYQHALEDFSCCLQINPFQFDTFYSRAQAYFYLGDYTKALADCKQALNIEPDSSQAQKLRALLKSSGYHSK